MKFFARHLALLALLVCLPTAALHAATVKQTIEMFRSAGVRASFFERSYGYAVFPTVGAGAFAVGGAFGKGRVYVHGIPMMKIEIASCFVGLRASPRIGTLHAVRCFVGRPMELRFG